MWWKPYFINQIPTSVPPQRDHSAPAGEFALPHARWTAEKNSNWATRMWARTDAPDAGEFRVPFTCVSRDGACCTHMNDLLSRCVYRQLPFSPVPCLKEPTRDGKRKKEQKKIQLPQNCDGVRGIRVWRILKHAVKCCGMSLWHTCVWDYPANVVLSAGSS